MDHPRFYFNYSICRSPLAELFSIGVSSVIAVAFHGPLNCVAGHQAATYRLVASALATSEVYQDHGPHFDLDPVTNYPGCEPSPLAPKDDVHGFF